LTTHTIEPTNGRKIQSPVSALSGGCWPSTTERSPTSAGMMNALTMKRRKANRRPRPPPIPLPEYPFNSLNEAYCQ